MFFYSLPILFNEIGIIRPFELLVILAGLLAILHILTPEMEKNFQPPPSESFLLSCWLGQMRLVWVFWPYFIVLNASLIVADMLGKTGKITVSSWDEIHFVLLITVVWWINSVWRCSGLTEARIWATLARLATIAVLMEYALKLLIRIDYPRLFFNCEDILLNYGSCF